MIMKNHIIKCPVCGRSTFSDHNSHEICKYCGWENEDYYESGGANELSLEEYKKKYNSIIAYDPGYIWKNDWNKKKG